MSTVVDLLQPLLAGGIQRNHFFNGRLLSAEDLRAEQDASRAQARGLAQGLGEGVAQGLEVQLAGSSPATSVPTLRVGAGIGFNRLGDPVRLAAPCELRLVPPATTASVPGGLFAACEAPLNQPSLLSASIWVLVALPSSGLEGRAPMADLQAIAAGRGHCGARFATEGIAFRLVPVDPDQPHTLLPAALDPSGTRQAALRSRIATEMAGSTPEHRARLRSLLAHVALGSDGVPAGATSWGLLDALRQRRLLTDCDLPLALLVLGAGGLRVLDGWAVRRPCAGLAAVDGWRALGAGGRRTREGEAALLQFQAQLAGIAPQASAAATRWLHALPAAGWLPEPWDWRAFLGQHAPPQATPVDAALLRRRIVEGFDEDAVVLDRTPLAALRVFRADGVPGVVFARSHEAELRATVRLAAGAASAAAVSLGVQPLAGAVVQTSRAGPGLVALAGVPPGEGARLELRATGHERLEATLPRLTGGQVLQLQDLVLVPLKGGRLEVQTLDAASGRSLGGDVLSVRALQGGLQLDLRRDGGRDRWIVDEVPEGRWQVVGDAPGFRAAVADDVGPVAAGQVLSVVLAFERGDNRLERPELCIAQSAALGTSGVLQRLSRLRLCLVLAGTVFDAQYHAARQPTLKARRQDPDAQLGLATRGAKGGSASGKLGFGVSRSDGVLLSSQGSGPWDGYTRVPTKAGALRDWIHAWRAWFAAAFDDASLLEREPQLRVAPDYAPPSRSAGTARGFRETPPAWIDFGPFSVPVALKFDDGRTRAPVPLDTGAPFLDRRAQRALAEAGLPTVDDLAWAWTDLLVDATGLPETDLWLAMQEAQEAVRRINDERAWIDGLTREDNERLKQAGFDTDTKLANATEAQLREVVGSAYKARSIKQQAVKAVVKPRVAKGKKAPPGGALR